MLLGWHNRGYYHNAYGFNEYLAARGYVVLSVNYRSGIGYGEAVAGRSRGGFVAAEKGAGALVIRSVGTDNDRLPHTGNMSSTMTGPAVPSAAIWPSSTSAPHTGRPTPSRPTPRSRR